MIDLSGKTMASILSSMLLRVTEQVNKRDGSLIKTALSAAAWAIEGIYIELIEIQKQAYGTTATGNYLDLKVEERGLYRHQATSCVCEMKSNLSSLTLGTQFADSSNNTWSISRGVIDAPVEGLYTYQITCATAGAIPEPSGSLRPLSFIAGLTTAIFDNVVAPGQDIETDESLRARYEESLIEIAFAGNIAAYRELIIGYDFPVGNTTANVGALQVFASTNDTGQNEGGHVKIWIVNNEFKVASAELISSVQDVVCPMYNGVTVGSGNGFAPIGAAVHISSATSTPVLSIDIKVIVKSTSSLETVTEKIRPNVLSYVNAQLSTWNEQVKLPTDTVSIVIREAFIYAASLVDGVADVTSVTLKKDNVTYSGQASWNTTRASMEWIDIDSVVINVSE